MSAAAWFAPLRHRLRHRLVLLASLGFAALPSFAHAADDASTDVVMEDSTADDADGSDGAGSDSGLGARRDQEIGARPDAAPDANGPEVSNLAAGDVVRTAPQVASDCNWSRRGPTTGAGSGWLGGLAVGIVSMVSMVSIARRRRRR